MLFVCCGRFCCVCVCVCACVRSRRTCVRLAVAADHAAAGPIAEPVFEQCRHSYRHHVYWNVDTMELDCPLLVGKQQ